MEPVYSLIAVKTSAMLFYSWCIEATEKHKEPWSVTQLSEVHSPLLSPSCGSSAKTIRDRVQAGTWNCPDHGTRFV